MNKGQTQKLIFIFFLLLSSGCSSLEQQKKRINFNSKADFSTLEAVGEVSLELKDKCAKGLSPSCLKAGQILLNQYTHYQEGVYSKEELLLKAYDYLLAACLLNDPRGCLLAASWKTSMGRDLDAMDFYERACQLKSAKACYEMGLEEKRYGNSTDTQKYYFNMACEYGHLESCRQSALIYNQEQRSTYSLKLFDKICHEGQDLLQSESCFNAAQLAYELKDKKLAKTYLIKSCEASYAQACMGLAHEAARDNFEQEAMLWIKKAYNLGLHNLAVLEFDEDFTTLRKKAEFQALIQEIKKVSSQ